MDVWITPEDLRTVVMPDLNSIWSQANIEWRVSAVDTVTALAPADRTERLKRLAESRRSRHGRGDPERWKTWKGLIEFAPGHSPGVDVYIVPYLGETSQGHAWPGRRRVMVGAWTDKPSHGQSPPVRVKLVESGPFQVGSLSRTLAHELGHILGLHHPEKQSQKEFGRLMGGRKPGTLLTSVESEVARRQASSAFR